MLEPYLSEIYSRGIILASGSWARQYLLKQIDLQFTVQVSGFAEDADWRTFENPKEYALFNARNKANCIESEGIIISADTVGEVNGIVLEKAVDENDARRMIALWNGGTCLMHTAVVIKGKTTNERVCTTEIEFDKLPDEIVDYYVRSREWEGAAGAIVVEKKCCSTFIKRYNGCFNNVMGMPLNMLCNMLIEEVKYARSQNSIS